MKIQDLVNLFGSNAHLIALSGGLFLASLIVVAFLQGRTITVGRTEIGPRPDVHPSRPDDEAPTNQPAPASEPAEVVDHEYPVERAVDFYQKITPNYDLRNSGNLVSTHLATVAQLQAARAQRPTLPLRVLDLGGGTGKLIAIHFFNDDAVSWTYVDFCPAMAAAFRRNLAGHPLGRNSTVVVEDVNRALQQLEPESYDVVLISLVLSSMPALPDFASIKRLMAPSGLLVVTDINPGYTRENPLYKVSVDGAIIALRTTEVDPFEVNRRARAAGLDLTKEYYLGEGDTYYSFITVFTPAAVRPTDKERGDESLVRM